MIPHVSTDIYEDTVSFKMPLNDSEFFCFVEFYYGDETKEGHDDSAQKIEGCILIYQWILKCLQS